VKHKIKQTHHVLKHYEVACFWEVPGIVRKGMREWRREWGDMGNTATSWEEGEGW